jgi:hypothetical protein
MGIIRPVITLAGGQLDTDGITRPVIICGGAKLDPGGIIPR